MSPPKRSGWTAPARYEAHNDGCDCFYHNRVFTHIGIGPIVDGRGRARPRLELERRVDVRHHEDGRNSRCMTIVLDGAKIEVVRSVDPRMSPPWMVWFGAWYGDPRDRVRSVRLSARNDLQRRAPDGGDPTLIWSLPAPWPAGSELIIWREAWWWSLIDGVDPLHVDLDVHAG